MILLLLIVLAAYGLFEVLTGARLILWGLFQLLRHLLGGNR